MLFNSDFRFGLTKMHLRAPKIVPFKYYFFVFINITWDLQIVME
jgi:hypothetical protein